MRPCLICKETPGFHSIRLLTSSEIAVASLLHMEECCSPFPAGEKIMLIQTCRWKRWEIVPLLQGLNTWSIWFQFLGHLCICVNSILENKCVMLIEWDGTNIFPCIFLCSSSQNRVQSGWDSCKVSVMVIVCRGWWTTTKQISLVIRYSHNFSCSSWGISGQGNTFAPQLMCLGWRGQDYKGN